MGYGQMVRDKRIEIEMSLRDLSAITGIDVGYLSRVERESVAPPQSEEILDAIHEALKLTKAEQKTFNDQSSFDNERFPKGVADKLKDVQGIPMLLRTVANKKPSSDDIQDIIKYINEHY